MSEHNEEIIDIISLDKEIRNSFQIRKKSIDKYNKKIEDLKDISKDSPRLKALVANDIEKLTLEMNDIQNDLSLELYVSDSTPVIEEYKKRLNEPIKIDFMNNTVDERDNSDVINKFMKVANKYRKDKKENVRSKSRSLSSASIDEKCSSCGSTNFDIIDDNIYTCIKCGSCKEFAIQTNITERVNVSLKYTYERLSHFINCANRYQAKQNTYIKPEIYEALEKYFEMNGLLIGDKNTPKEERFKRITKKDIYIGLKENGYNKHYEDLFLIHHILTGTPNNDISQIEPLLYRDFETLSNLYDEKYKNELDRTSFLNSKYILYHLLRKYKYKCDDLLFLMLKTYERRTFYDDVCKNLFTQLGWNFESAF